VGIDRKFQKIMMANDILRQSGVHTMLRHDLSESLKSFGLFLFCGVGRTGKFNNQLNRLGKLFTAGGLLNTSVINGHDRTGSVQCTARQ
jgi:hypothetical protein